MPSRTSRRQDMTRRDRLMRTLRGEAVDRPPVCFYEINGHDERPDNPDPFNIYTHPSWRPLIELARDHSDRIVMRSVSFNGVLPDPVDAASTTETVIRDGSRHTTTTVRIGSRVLTARTRRDPDVNTVWTTEHLLKSVEDLEAYLSLPAPARDTTPHVQPVLDTEAALGDTGIVMVDTADPLCLAAMLFSMEDYTIIALTEPALFHRLLERCAARLWRHTEQVARALPGRLWRICGPEYAAPPYLPPRLFREYVVRYVTPMIEAIHAHGGYARIHSHGRLRDIIDDIAGTGCDGLDPIEPPPQGDMTLREVRARHGRQLVLFGNLEASDLENLPEKEWAGKVRQALDEGTAGKGRGFVLMPSASPYGRVLSPRTMKNYDIMIEIATAR